MAGETWRDRENPHGGIGNRSARSGVVQPSQTPEGIMLKGVVAWLLGVPLIVIIALYVFHVF